MRQYLDTIDKSDADEFFSYTNKQGTLLDLLETLKNPSIPVEYMDGISADEISRAASEYGKKKKNKFQVIFLKKGWDKNYCPSQIYINETGEVYVYETPLEDSSCSCDCKSKK
jgi:hypothetical protein